MADLAGVGAGAASGAAMGAIGGPIGMAVGAVAGGIMGALSKKKETAPAGGTGGGLPKGSDSITGSALDFGDDVFNNNQAFAFNNGAGLSEIAQLMRGDTYTARGNRSSATSLQSSSAIFAGSIPKWAPPLFLAGVGLLAFKHFRKGAGRGK
jgi:hypothetical protein